MITKQWLDKYELVKEKLMCNTDLESYFSKKQIGEINIDILEIGNVHFPTGVVFACDPFIEMEDALPYIQKVPAGIYPVKICVIPNQEYGNRYACVKVEICNRKPIRYELGMTGTENLEQVGEDGGFFGFCVDAGMGCIADIQTQEAYTNYLEECEDIDSLLCDILAKSYKENPQYQTKYGNWANWTIPKTDCNILIFSSGWGDGVYPCYFGYDEKGDVCGLYILFIDIENEFEE